MLLKYTNIGIALYLKSPHRHVKREAGLAVVKLDEYIIQICSSIMLAGHRKYYIRDPLECSQFPMEPER